MSLLWGGFKSRDKTRHCIHQERSAQLVEPQEEPILEAKQPPNQAATAHAVDVNPSGVDKGNNVQPIARDSKGRCQICRQEQLAARRYRMRLIIGIFFPFALQALDTTIVASALSFIASDFGKYCHIFCSPFC